MAVHSGGGLLERLDGRSRKARSTRAIMASRFMRANSCAQETASYVVLEVLRSFDEVGQVLVGQVNEEPPHVVLREFDVVPADGIADTARPRVQHRPDGVVLVQADLDEVVAGPQRAEVADGAIGGPAQPGRAGDDGIKSSLERTPIRDDGRGRVFPRSLVPSPAGGAPVRNAALDFGYAGRLRSSGRSLAPREVRTAIIPQPMSTPTAAGTMAPDVGMTEPTVAPNPQCTSGIAATCLCTNGSRAVLRSWSHAFSSTGTPCVHALIGAPPGRVFENVALVRERRGRSCNCPPGRCCYIRRPSGTLAANNRAPRSRIAAGSFTFVIRAGLKPG